MIVSFTINCKFLFGKNNYNYRTITFSIVMANLDAKENIPDFLLISFIKFCVISFLISKQT